MLQPRAIGGEVFDPIMMQKPNVTLDHERRTGRVEDLSRTASPDWPEGIDVRGSGTPSIMAGKSAFY
jgi:hypothetical protein